MFAVQRISINYGCLALKMSVLFGRQVGEHLEVISNERLSDSKKAKVIANSFNLAHFTLLYNDRSDESTEYLGLGCF